MSRKKNGKNGALVILDGEQDEAAIKVAQEKIDQTNIAGVPYSRTPKDIVEDRKVIAECMCKHMTTPMMQKLLNTMRPYRISEKAVVNDRIQVTAAWQMEAQPKLRALKLQELRSISHQEQEAWSAWEKSKEDKKTVSQEKVEGGVKPDAGVKMKVEKYNQAGDPRYLLILVQLRQQRMKIQGTEAPLKLDIQGAIGHGLDPQTIRLALRQTIEAQIKAEAQMKQATPTPPVHVIAQQTETGLVIDVPSA